MTSARVSAWIAVLALVAGLAVAPPWRDADEIPGGFAGRLVGGDLERLDDGRWVTVRQGELVQDEADVRSTDGADIAVSGGTLRLSRAARAELGAMIVLEAGSLLLENGGERTVGLGSLVATGQGIWRVDATPRERVAVYAGGVGIRAASTGSDGLAISRLEQADLVGGRLPAETLPLRYSAEDQWDARFLVSAIAVDGEIERLAASLMNEHGEEPQPAEFFAAFVAFSDADVAALGRLGLGDGEDLIGPPAEVLVFGTVARMVAEATGGTFEEGVERVASLRRAGATWGLVLMRHDLGPGDLFDALDLTLTEPEPEPVVDPEPETGPTPPEPGGVPPPTGPTPPAPPPPSPPGTAPPPDDDEDDEDDEDGDGSGVVDVVNDAVIDLGQLIGDTLSGVGGLLGP